MSIAVVANFYSEPHALPGFITEAEKTFDEIVFVHSPPPGAKPDDSVDIVRKSGHKLVHSTVEHGFGKLRTFCISQTKCDWVMILDADERIFSKSPNLHCEGSEAYPAHKNPNLSVHLVGEEIDQRHLIRRMCELADINKQDAIRLCRRHWFDEPGKFQRPCQNWIQIPDWQLRLVRNTPFVFYRPERKMHEELLHSKSWQSPEYLAVSNTGVTVFVDHFHCYYKPMEKGNNAEDMRTYQALDKGLTAGMWIEEADGVKTTKKKK